MIRALMLILLAGAAPGRTEADALFDGGEWSAARDAYQAVLEETTVASERAAILDRIGLTLLREGRLWDAEAQFTLSLEAEETAAAHLHRGQVFFYSGVRTAAEPGAPGAEIRALMNDAAREIRKSIAMAPDRPEAHVSLGLCERYRLDAKKEEEAYRRALELDPGRPDASLHLAWIVEARGGTAAALELLGKVERGKRTVEHWMALGRLAGKSGDDEGRSAAYLEAVKLAPEEHSTYQGLWDATALQKRFAEFERAMESVLQSHPEAWLPHYYMGFCHRYAKRPRAAIASFTKALEARPTETRARFYIAEILREDLKDTDGSIPHYLRVLEEDPGSADALRLLDWLAYEKTRAGDVEAARELYAALRKAAPGEVAHVLNLAITEKELNRPEAAISLYREAMGSFPFDPQIANDLGLLLMGLGREEEALASFREALERDSEFLDALENLGAISLLEGDLEAALSYFKRAHERVRREGGDASKFRRYLDFVAREREDRG